MSLRHVFAPLVLLASAALSSASGPLLGKMGQAVAATAIYASPTTRARVFYRVKPYEYLIVRNRTAKAGWVRILMSNGIDAYTKKEKVIVLPYEVRAKEAPATAPAYRNGRSTAPASRGSMGNTVVDQAMAYRGTPYVWGGNDLRNGIDCSGFVKQLYGHVGLNLPRTAAEQSLVGQPITRLEDLRAGDRLYFWERKRGIIGHTGIYMGNGYFVHSSRGHRGVATDALTKGNWLKILVAARR